MQKELSKGEHLQLHDKQIKELRDQVQHLHHAFNQSRLNENKMAQMMDGLKIIINSFSSLLKKLYNDDEAFEKDKEMFYQAELDIYQTKLMEMLEKDGFKMNEDGSISPVDSPPVEEGGEEVQEVEAAAAEPAVEEKAKKVLSLMQMD